MPTTEYGFYEKKSCFSRRNLIEIAFSLTVICRMPFLCPHFPACGGCRLQDKGESAYRAHKTEWLESLLLRNEIEPSERLPLLVTPPGTRRRARLAALQTKNGLLLGFNGWHSHTIIDVKSCPVLLPALETLIVKLREPLSKWLPMRGTCDLQLTILPDGLDIVLIGGPPLDLNARMTLAEMAEQLDISHLSWRKDDRLSSEPLSHRKPLSIQFGETRVPFPPGSFLQATTFGEKALIDFARERVKEGDTFLDLFSGLGTFGLSLTQAKTVHFADADGPALDALSAALKGQTRYRVEKRDLMRDPIGAATCESFDIVLFDPPRGGAKAQARELAQSNARTIIAISCDPPTFMRDAKILIAGGYKLESLQPVDQFLFSEHLELAAIFKK